MKPSAIGWADFSGGNLNFVSSCTKVSEGCRSCCAEAIYKRFGRDFSEVMCSEDKLHAAIAARYELTAPAVTDRFIYKRGYGSKPICFVCDTGDLFHVDVPNEFVVGAMGMMGQRTDVDWMILTKRPERIAQIALEEDSLFSRDEFYPNVWIGVTAENQQRADERIPILLSSWAGPKFVSVEPCLEQVDLSAYIGYNPTYNIDKELLNGIQTERRDCLRGRVSGDIGNRRLGPGVANCDAERESLEQGNEFDTLQSQESRTRQRGILPGAHNARWSESGMSGSASGMETLLRLNTDRPNGQSQGWSEKEKQPREPGTSNIFGTDDSFDERAGATFLVEDSERREQPASDIDGRSGAGNPQPARSNTDGNEDQIWQENNGACRETQRELPVYLGHNQGAQMGISWCIIGAESGANRRPFKVEWAKHLYQQCQMEDTAFFGKQDSGAFPGVPLLIDSKVIHEWPESR